MTGQTVNPQKQNQGQNAADENPPGRENRPTEDGGTRQYEGGKNPAMQAQRGQRQGSGQPTQQRPEDR